MLYECMLIAELVLLYCVFCLFCNVCLQLCFIHVSIMLVLNDCMCRSEGIAKDTRNE